jgi:hypothetical protein
MNKRQMARHEFNKIVSNGAPSSDVYRTEAAVIEMELGSAAREFLL